MPIVLHVGVEINPVVDLAAAFADKGQAQAIEEARTAADVGGGLGTGVVAGGRWRTRCGGSWRCAGATRCARLHGEVERHLRRRRG